MKRGGLIVTFLMLGMPLTVCQAQEQNEPPGTWKILPPAPTLPGVPGVPSAPSNEQAKPKWAFPVPESPGATLGPISPKATPAYGELVLHKTEVEAELKELLVTYTEKYPRVKEKRAELEILNREMKKIAKMDPAMAPKLTATVGSLILNKVALETELYKMRQLQAYVEKNPHVQDAKNKLAALEQAVKEVLQ